MSRAQAKEASRDALVQAACALFAEQGFDGPSLDAVCARAGFTRGAFYVHFPDREALIAAAMERWLAGWVRTIEVTGDPGGDLARSVQGFIRAVGEARAGRGDPERAEGIRQLGRLLAGAQRSERARTRLVEVLSGARRLLTVVVAAGQRAGTVRADVPPDGLAAMLVSTVLGVLTAVEVDADWPLAAAEEAALALLRPSACVRLPER
jgi:TetR/AcrR family transcriptional repressor of nem operon